jgi:cytoskeletal protein CcmA (bactofilin family)
MSFRSSLASGDQTGVATAVDSRYGPDDRGSFSVIDRYSVFDGTFRAERDLRVEGEVKGTIDCHGTLYVAEGATVDAKVEAENITVAGNLSGDIQCRGRVQLLPSGRLRGRVNTTGLVISEGALYEGDLAMPDPNGGGSGSSSSRAPRRGPVAVAMPAQRSSATRDAPPVTVDGEGMVTPSTFIRRLGGPETPWEAPAGESSDQSTPTDEPQ